MRRHINSRTFRNFWRWLFKRVGLLTRAILYTQDSARTQRTGLQRLVESAAAAGRFLEVRYEPRLHHRSIELSTGIVIMSDRGLDMYEAPPRGLRRRAAGRAARLCRGGVVEIFSREPAPTIHQDEKQKRPPLSRSGKRCIATPKLGRGTPPKTNLAMRQPDFNEVDVDIRYTDV